jgi:MoaA/NifB/PqqE/SkfB family radical SAM enzyme
MDSLKALGVEWVVLSGGEPLLHSNLGSICELFRDLGVRLTLLTTGLLLKKKASFVTHNFDEVIVSLDGPREVHDRIRRVTDAFDLIAAGIRQLRELKPELPIHARLTVQRENFEHLLATIMAAKELQFSSVSLLPADVTSTAFNRELVWPISRQSEVALAPQQIEKLAAEIERIVAARGQAFPFTFVAEDDSKLRRIVSHFEAQLGLRTPAAPKCNAPWVSAVVEANGSVRPCFFQPAFGNIYEQDFKDLLNSQEAVEFRQSLDIPSNPTCQRCVCSLYRS